MATMLKDSLRTIQVHKTLSPHYTELLEVLEEILILREEHRRRVKRAVFPVEEKLIAAKMAGGLPLVDFSTVDFDLREPQEYFLALLEIAERRSPGETGEMARKIREGEIRFNDLIYESFNPLPLEETGTAQEALEEGEQSLDLVELFIEESLRPSLEKVVERYGDVIGKSGWSEGYCPVCGREPKIGEIRDEEGSRFLFCNQCGFEWSYRRIKCPFCGNEEQQTLAYFTIEEDDRYRVDVCNECKRYIKIIDFRKSKQKADLDVEDIATLHLDMMANDEGYD
ncbi:MAG: formate dehydrogenase accessory protein FdhE [Deltaproteobacteria bacterium]|nr:formate dehydrogenase accessory protein FdhE [Deltaproteobacteria bacterium]